MPEVLIYDGLMINSNSIVGDELIELRLKEI